MLKTLLAAVFCISMSANALAQNEGRRIATRFGDLNSDEDLQLTFKGKAVQPPVLTTAGVGEVAHFKLDSSDVVLFSQDGGSSCPGLYFFVTVSNEGAKVSPDFGTCTDAEVKPVQVGQSIAFSMKNAKGKGTTRYIFERGIVFEDGNPIK